MLFCVFGNSGAGKDTIIKKLLDDQYIGMRDHPEDYTMMPKLKKLTLVTTRPPRVNEECDPETGMCYYDFLNKSDFIYECEVGTLVESRSYRVASANSNRYETWSYGTYEEDLLNALTSDDLYFVTCTPHQFSAYYNFAKYYEMVTGENYRDKLYPIFIAVRSEKERLLRTINRSNDSFYDLREVCRRFASDCEYIDQTKVPEQFLVYNDNVDDTANYILNLIDTFDPNGTMEITDTWKIDCTCPDTFGNLINKEMLK